MAADGSAGVEAAREALRLAALARYAPLADGAREGLDRITRLAARRFDAAVAMMNFIDGQRVWSAASHGAPPFERGSAGALCDVTVRRRAPFVVPDLALDARFRDAFPPEVARFYAGAPLLTPDGHAIGTLCVLDAAPRAAFDADALRALEDHAAIAMTELRLRHQAVAATRRADADARRARLMARAAEAADFDGVVDVAVQALRDATGALFAVALRMTADGRAVVPIGCAAGGDLDAGSVMTRLRAMRLDVETTATGRAMAAGSELIVRGAREIEALGLSTLFYAMSIGARTVIVRPMTLGGRSYAFTIGLADEDPDVAARVAETMADTVEMLRPAFLRLRGLEDTLLMRRALDACGEGVAIAETPSRPDETPRIIYANPSLCAMTGWSAQDLMGQSPFVLLAGADDPAFRGRISSKVRPGGSYCAELLNRRRDGSTFWGAVAVAGVRDAVGAVTHTVSIRRDVTAAREEARRVAESEAAFRGLFDNNPIPMWIFDRATLRFVKVNEAAVQSYGFSRERFLAMTMADIRPPEDAPEMMKRIAGLEGADGVVSGAHRHRDSRGELRWIEARSYPLSYEGRACVLTAVWDVTRRKRAEDALLEAQALARIGAWRRSADGRRGEWSPEMFRIFEIEPTDSAPPLEMALARVDEADRAAVAERLAAARFSDALLTCEFGVTTLSGERRRCRGGARRSPRDAGDYEVEGYVQDITETHRAAETLRQAEKLSAIGQLTGGVAHDFNNLLTVALANLELAQGAAPGEDTAALLAAARGALERGAGLTRQLLAFARRQPLTATAVAPGPFLDDLLSLVERTLGARRRLRRVVADGAPAAHCDPAQLEAALLNLILNARDASPKGSPIRLDAAAADAAAIARAGLPPGVYLEITVSDSGPGIPACRRAQALEPFFTTKPHGKGTGLGLSMAQGFARQSGGDLLLDDAPEGGLAARLILPAATRAATEPESDPQATGEIGAIDILLVEDDPDVRRVADAMLRALSTAPVCVASADEALRLLRGGLRVDLLFSDVTLGDGMDGQALGAAAQAVQPGLPVLLTSGYNDVVKPGSPFPLLPKPYALDDLRAAVAQALAAAR